MFDRLERDAIARRAEFEVAEASSQSEMEEAKAHEKATEQRNALRLETLSTGLDQLRVDDILQDAQSLVEMDPKLKDEVRLRWKRFDWMPRAFNMQMVKEFPDALNTPSELQAMSGYACFLDNKDNDGQAKGSYRRFQWEELHYPNRRLFTSSILYVVGYASGDSQTDYAPRIVVAGEQLEEEPKRDTRDDPLWKLLEEPHRISMGVMQRRRINELRARASARLRGQQVGGLRPRPTPPNVMRPGGWELKCINELFEEPREVGWLVKRTVGGHYAKQSEPLLTTDPGTVDAHRYGIYKAVENWILKNPFVPLD